MALSIGARVEISPHFDLWMRGARFGTIRSIKDGVAKVKMDHEAVKGLRSFPVKDLTPAWGPKHGTFGGLLSGGFRGLGGLPPTAAEWRGWQKAIRDARRDSVGGGLTFNDNYNKVEYGMTRARYNELLRAAEDKLGMDWREAKRSELS